MKTQLFATIVAIAALASFGYSQDAGTRPGARRSPVRPQQAERVKAMKERVRARVDRFAEKNPDMKAKIEEIRSMTPEQRKQKIQEFRNLSPDAKKAKVEKFMAEHPEAKARRDKFLEEHPKAKERIEKFKALTPEERKAKAEAAREKFPHFMKRMKRLHRALMLSV